jgi:hypothetical protein
MAIFWIWNLLLTKTAKLKKIVISEDTFPSKNIPGKCRWMA